MTDAALALRILEALPHAVSVVDAGGRLAFANQAFWRDAGVAPAACPPGSAVRDLVRLLAYRGLYGGGDPEALAEAVLALDRSRPSRRQIGLADGSRSLEAVSVPLPGGGFVSIAHDITALLRAREEQAARARLLEGTLARLHGGVGRFDAELRLTVFNAAYEALSGLPGGTLRPGLTHREIIALLDANGEFAASGGPEAVATRMEADRQRPSRRQRTRPSGEVVRFDSQPTPDGGFLIEVTDITALKRAEDEATRRAGLLDGVLDALPHGVCLFGPDRRVRRINAAYQRMMAGSGVALGDRLEDIIARRLATGEYDPETAAAVERRFAPGTEAYPPVRRRRPNGTVLENSMARLPDGGVISVFTDVTALQRAEEAGRQRAAVLDGVLQALPHGVCVYGPDQRVAMFNDAYARIMEGAPIAIGEHIEEVTARRVAQGEYGRDYADDMRSRHRHGEVVTDGTVRRRPNGTVISVRAVMLPDGGHISVVTDVTAQHRAEEEARRRAAMLEASFAGMRHGIAIFGPDRRLLAANEPAADLTGVPDLRQWVGRGLDEVLAEQATRGWARPEQVTMASRLDRSRPTRYLRTGPDGRIVEVLSDPTPDGGFVVTYSDVTALHRAEEELRRRAAILEASFATMRHGIAVWGPDRRLLAWNQRMPDLLGVPPSVLFPGQSFDALLGTQVAQGVLAAEEAAHIRARDRTRPQRSSRNHPDGRNLELFSDPTPDGGFVITLTDVTALQQAQAESRRRAALLESSFAAIRQGIAVFGPDGRLLAFNDQVADLAGVPLEHHVVGRPFGELLAEQVARGVISEASAQEALAWDRKVPRRRSRRGQDGRIVEVMSDPTPDGGFVVTFTDVTALRRAEEELRRRAAMLEASFGAMRHGISIFGPDRRLIACNERTYELTGVPPEAYRPGRTVDELIAEQVARGVISAQAAAAAHALDRGQAHRASRVQPGGRVIETSSDPTPDGGFVVTFADVTALRRAEAELGQRAAMQEAMLGNIRHGIVLYGPDRRLLATNAKTAELIGLPPGRVAHGRTMDELLDEEVARGVIHPDQAAAMKALDRSRTQHYTRLMADGRVLDTLSEPTPDGGYVITHSDVTADRQIRAELERARAAAEAASEAKSRFLATMSHELRTPLNVVIGLSEAIGIDRDRARVEDYAGMINEAGRHLLQLVDDILDVARSQTGALATAEEPVAPAEVAAAAAGAAAPAAAAAGLELVTALPEGLPWLRGDARRLRQVLDKLLSNAVKFTPSGGRVTLSAAAEAGGLAIRVADTGIGIPPAERERMFEPFTQLDSSLARRFQGSGLGLHLARLLAGALGATLALEDPEGPGIVAVLRFPPARLMPAPGEAAAASPAEAGPLPA